MGAKAQAEGGRADGRLHKRTHRTVLNRMAERINEPTKAVTMYRNSTKRSQIVEEIPGLSKNAAVEIAETNPLPEVVERIARTEQRQTPSTARVQKQTHSWSGAFERFDRTKPNSAQTH
jgi:hypothetical protein